MSDRLGAEFEERLRAELDRVRPPTPMPENARFAEPRPRFRRFGRLQLAVGMAGALAVVTVVAASAASGTDPASWPQRAVTTVESVTHVGEPAPSPAPEKPSQTETRPPAQSEPSKPKTAVPQRNSPESSDGSRTEPKESPEATPKQSRVRPSPSPSPSPNSDDRHSSSGWGAPSENRGSD
jgi:hypothetical protein